MNPVPSRLRVPAESYAVEVTKMGFQTQRQTVNVAILSAPMLRFTLTMAGVESDVSMTAEAVPVNRHASSPPVTVEESDILPHAGS